MSSGRSARLPPTPISAANVVRHVVDVTALTAIDRRHPHSGYAASATATPTAAASAAAAAAPANRADMCHVPLHDGAACRPLPVADAAAAAVAAACVDVGAADRPMSLAVATSQVLDSLSERERQIIMDVLQRDEQVRRRDATRIM